MHHGTRLAIKLAGPRPHGARCRNAVVVKVNGSPAGCSVALGGRLDHSQNPLDFRPRIDAAKFLIFAHRAADLLRGGK